MSRLLIDSVEMTERFASEIRKVDSSIRDKAKVAIAELLKNPEKGSLRLHPLSAYGKPTVWKIDVFPNHSWQITFEMHGKCARLLRLATHTKIDASPR